MVLDIKNLKVEYQVERDGKQESLTAVNDVSFKIDKGESFGLVGESGCGKSTIVESIMKILPKNGQIPEGNIEYKGRDLVPLKNSEMRNVRWEEIALISQSAMNAFDPVYTIGDQIRETIREHKSWSKEKMDSRIQELFQLVGIDPNRADDYPHQFSGGMKQRAMIAMALVLEPDLIIADEPTTALDVISQDTILHHLETLQEETGASLLLITHDMSVVAEVCDRTGVMYAGEIAEIGPTNRVFTEPYHPYTLGLKNAFPTVDGEEKQLISIPGVPPDLVDSQNKCKFVDRCPFAQSECYEETPSLEFYDEDHQAACFRINEVGPTELRRQAKKPETWSAKSDNDSSSTREERTPSQSESQ